MKMTKKQLFEAVKRAKSLVNDRLFENTTFEQMLEPAMKMLDQVAQSDLHLPPLDDDAVVIQNVLNTSEDDLNPANGTKQESWYRKNSQSLQEGLTSQDVVNQFVRETGEDSWDAFNNWMAGKSGDILAKAQKVNKWMFTNKLIPNVAIPDSNAPTEPKAPIEMSDNLRNLIDMTDANQEVLETATTTVTDKYDMIEAKLERVLTGRSAKRYFLLAGDPGIGKTYAATDVLKRLGITDVPTLTGSIGKSTSAIAEFLYTYRDTPTVILDDCDAFLRDGGNPEVVGILKGAMEPGTKYQVHLPTNIAKLASKNIDPTYRDSDDTMPTAEEIEAQVKFKMKKEGMSHEDAEAAVQADIEAIHGKAWMMPTTFTFNARLIILSNLHEKQIDSAIWSRCDHFDLHLTQEEYLVRLAAIINSMDVGEKDGLYTAEESRVAKALVLTTLTSVIEAGNKGVALFGKYVRLKDTLEFRLVKDLVESWYLLCEIYTKKHPGVDADTAHKECLKKWVRTSVIPRISA